MGDIYTYIYLIYKAHILMGDIYINYVYILVYVTIIYIKGVY